MTEYHDSQQQDDVEDIELVAIPLQHLVVEIHEKSRERNVHKREDTLTLHIPVALLSRCIDMGGAADNHQAHDEDARRRSDEQEIRAPEESFGHACSPLSCFMRLTGIFATSATESSSLAREISISCWLISI